ncbi:unnamed protein product [Mytilus edulis]|uniref:Ig-like domain-containing protein n=1 Tax=Mytilus edulis TaxID=6550 RepID=A0A8S3Q872_MYTED|nr:unnamed protein product [Mytilus edulis]
MSNETTVWSTAELKLNSTYNGTKCTCSIQSKDVDFAVSDFVTLKIENKPILNINDEFHCNSSSTVALVCSARGELTMFGFARWTHTVDGIYIRSLYGITEKYISILIINDCTFKDGGDYTCSAWNKAGDSILWTNKTTLLHFTGRCVMKLICNYILPGWTSSYLEHHGGRNEYWSANCGSILFKIFLVSVKWQCNGVLLNHSIVEQIPMELEIYNKFITLSGYKTSIPVSSHECDRDKCSICLSNEFTGHCEQVYFKKSENGYNVFWVMFVIVLCIVAVGISPTLLAVIRTHRNQASQSIQLDSSTNDERYLQIYEPDQIATHQYDAALRTYIDPVPYHSARGYAMTGRPYNDLVQTVYESSRGYDVTSPEYLDVQPDTDTNSQQSDQYEKVD